jgi:DNA-binding Lrp family transcriptional regulator
MKNFYSDTAEGGCKHNMMNFYGQDADYDSNIDATDGRIIELLLKGYTNKNIALHERMPLSTVQRRIRRIYEKGYVIKRNELNYKKLGLRKVYLLISLKGDLSSEVAQNLSNIEGVNFVSIVSGGIEILCVCLIRDTDHLFKILENIRAIERVDNVTWVEEVSVIPADERPIQIVEAALQ